MMLAVSRIVGIITAKSDDGYIALFVCLLASLEEYALWIGVDYVSFWYSEMVKVLLHCYISAYFPESWDTIGANVSRYLSEMTK